MLSIGQTKEGNLGEAISATAVFVAVSSYICNCIYIFISRLLNDENNSLSWRLVFIYFMLMPVWFSVINQFSMKYFCIINLYVFVCTRAIQEHNCQLYGLLNAVHHKHRRRKRGAGGRGSPPNNLRGGPTYPLPPPIIHPPFPSISMWNRKNHKCTKLKGKIIINATLIWFEGAGKTIPFNSILEFSILSDF